MHEISYAKLSWSIGEVDPGLILGLKTDRIANKFLLWSYVVVCSATNDFATVHVASSDNLFHCSLDFKYCAPSFVRKLTPTLYSQNYAC